MSGNFNFLYVQRQLTIRTAKLLQAFLASDNHLCSLFERVAVSKLNSILTSFSVKSTNQLVNGMYNLLQCALFNVFLISGKFNIQYLISFGNYV